jgi:hypothetical protein
MTPAINDAGGLAEQSPDEARRGRSARASDRSMRVLLSLGLLAACEPEHIRPEAIMLEYEDFGPPVMAHELLGNEWYAWSKPGSFEPDEQFDVHVVVYDGDRTLIERAYPTVKDRADYRLVLRADALAFLDASIAELANEHDRPLLGLRARLQSTRSRIIANLPTKP